MKIILDKGLANNYFSTEVNTEFTEQEDDLIEKFGDPEVNFGGTFTGPPFFIWLDNWLCFPLN